MTDLDEKDEIATKETKGDGPDLATQVKELTKKLSDQTASNERMATSKAAAQEKLATSEARLKELETKTEPPESSERIDNLEAKLARSEAQTTYGLSPEDAAQLTGSPDEITTKAKYWAERLKPTKTTDDTSKEDQTKDDSTKTDTTLETKDAPLPKKGDKTPWERYQAATPDDRRQLREKAQRGEINLAKGYKPS